MNQTDLHVAIIDGLNQQQAAAVTVGHPGPVLLLAGAGCGKTLVLTRRIAYCASEICRQEEILALTFTRKASLEMTHRLQRTPGIDLQRSIPLVATFHACALSILRDTFAGTRNFERAGYQKEPVLIQDNARMTILSECSAKEERRALGTDLDGLSALLDQRAVHPVKTAAQPAEKRSVLERIALRYDERKQNDGLWDFNDIMNRAEHLLNRQNDVRAHYASRYKVILVDEFQDTNPLQIMFLRDLGAQRNHLFAVGDDDQSIYGFRGADITPIMTFETSFPGSIILKLETNYRSTQAILNTANRIFRHKARVYRKHLRTGRYADRDENGLPWPGPVQKHFTSQKEMGAWVMSTSEQICREAAIAVDSMALLFRINQTLQWMKVFWEEKTGGTCAAPQFFTIHGAKGLEFPVVFLCDLEEEVLPSYRRTKKSPVRSFRELLDWFFTGYRPVPDECDIEEEKRLFYVGVTRAQQRLYLLSCGKKNYFGRTMKYRRSRFLRMV